MARISISIPGDLMARMDPIKDRINISQLCREALERRVSAFERAAKSNGTDLDVDELVTRLQEELVEEEGRFERLGQENAASWLRTAAYREFQSVAEAQTASGRKKPARKPAKKPATKKPAAKSVAGAKKKRTKKRA